MAQQTAAFQTALGATMAGGGILCLATYSSTAPLPGGTEIQNPIRSYRAGFLVASAPPLLAVGVPLMITGLVSSAGAIELLGDPINRGA